MLINLDMLFDVGDVKLAQRDKARVDHRHAGAALPRRDFGPTLRTHPEPVTAPAARGICI